MSMGDSAVCGCCCCCIFSHLCPPTSHMLGHLPHSMSLAEHTRLWLIAKVWVVIRMSFNLAAVWVDRFSASLKANGLVKLTWVWVTQITGCSLQTSKTISFDSGRPFQFAKDSLCSNTGQSFIFIRDTLTSSLVLSALRPCEPPQKRIVSAFVLDYSWNSVF